MQINRVVRGVFYFFAAIIVFLAGMTVLLAFILLWHWGLRTHPLGVLVAAVVIVVVAFAWNYWND